MATPTPAPAPAPAATPSPAAATPAKSIWSEPTPDASATPAAAPVADPTKAAAPAAAPKADEPWELQAPEWVTPEAKTQFETWGREQKLTKEQTQAWLTKNSEAQVAAYNAEFTRLAAQVKADPEIGGAKLPETMAAAKRGLMKLLPDAKDRVLLEQTPYGNHPLLVKILARAGAMMSEDSHVAGATTPAKTPAAPWQVLYKGDGKGPQRS